ncbi:MAG: DedA family protein [Gammaproteobacteria bacterium]|nr:DedA family protein [Gammaproteobacteria bacterium]
MSPDLQHLLSVYGYWLMAFGALIEGETFLIAGGIAAQHGIFHLGGLIALAVVGSTIHDCFFFLLGRYAGVGLFKRKPSFYERSKNILALFDKYGVWLIIGLRFAYGLRTIIPTVLGVSHISFKKFFIFDLIGGVIWSVTFIVGGYLFGATLEALVGNFSEYEYLFGIVIVTGFVLTIVVVIGLWLFRHLGQRKKRLAETKLADKILKL